MGRQTVLRRSVGHVGSAARTDTQHERLHALDAVRAFALIAGIVFHATMSFLPSPVGAPTWWVTDEHSSPTLALVFHVLHIFRMTTFFFIAGFFAHLMVERRGVGAFVRDRARRIALPLMVGWPILFALILLVTMWAATLHVQCRPPSLPRVTALPKFPLIHLWFLYQLLWLYAATLGLRSAVLALDRTGALRRLGDRIVGALTRNPAGVLVLAAPTAAVLATDQHWLAWAGIATPDSSLAPSGRASIAYFSAFAFGWLIHRQASLLQIWRRRWPLNLALALLFTALEIAMGRGFLPSLATMPFSAAKVAAAASYSLAVWTWTFAVVGLAHRYLDGFSAARRYIADSSYWLYLIHLPLIVALQAVVAQFAWPWEVKYALILCVAFPVMLLSYELLVRHSFIGWVLNGRRYPWPKQARMTPSRATKSAA